MAELMGWLSHPISAERVQLHAYRKGLDGVVYTGDRAAVLIAEGAGKVARDQRDRGVGVGPTPCGRTRRSQ